MVLLLLPVAENYSSIEYTERKSVLTAHYKLKKLLDKTFNFSFCFFNIHQHF